jgi:citrate lyase subunit beta/citryl-CoA lyase
MTLRSMLFVPADSDRKLAKAAGAGADALILDLEDSVQAQRKTIARGAVRDYLAAPHSVPVWIRINALQSGESTADLAAIDDVPPAGIVLPKIRGPEDLIEAHRQLSELESARGFTASSIALLALVTETPAAVLRMHELLAAPIPRLAALSWGAEDLSTALGAGDPRLPDGGWRPLYEYARCRVLLTAHALQTEVLDTVFVDFKDAEGLSRSCRASRYDGFTGRLAIHPDQVPIINAAFTPSEAELAFAQRVVDAFASGSGAVPLDGKMLDIPHLNAAKRLLALRDR